ncbi:hypothetical protein K457DRAFT_33424 [Linnemannia elongata AG-77]|uniref:Uncharacterized protein n=1 Tax=Linnemannia elongata AG-77 TaxID=1314771 RepID=A0A197JS73_9FUNG|nr:hypothetical protein K457DRAFT_33424 [Linnemannia elongata AG-77]
MSGEADLFLNSRPHNPLPNPTKMIKSTSIITLTAVILLLASSSSTSVVVQAVPVSVSTTSISDPNPVAVTVATTKRDETPGAAAPIAPAVGPITQNTEQVTGVFKGLSEYFAKLAENTVANNAVTNNDVVKPLTDSTIPQGVKDAATKPIQSAAKIVGGDSTSTTDGTAATDAAPQGGVVNQSG